jgi:hypothetical protein
VHPVINHDEAWQYLTDLGRVNATHQWLSATLQGSVEAREEEDDDDELSNIMLSF